MREIKFFLTVTLLLLIYSSRVFAEPWRFEITPYLWAINMNGTVGVGSTTARVNESFADLAKDMDVGGMVYLTAHYNNVGFYLNEVYASLSNEDQMKGIEIDGKNKFGVTGAGISYIVLNRSFANARKLILEPYLGARYTLNDTTLKADGFTFKKNVNWTDPVIGLQLDYVFNTCWDAQLAGDIGGTNINRDDTYSVSAFAKYKAASWQHLKTYLGYRLLFQHYETGSGDHFYDWDMKLFGPVVGIGYTF